MESTTDITMETITQLVNNGIIRISGGVMTIHGDRLRGYGIESTIVTSDTPELDDCTVEQAIPFDETADFSMGDDSDDSSSESSSDEYTRSHKPRRHKPRRLNRCGWLMIRGKRKGQPCGTRTSTDLCTRHSRICASMKEKKRIREENACKYVMTKGFRKGERCGKWQWVKDIAPAVLRLLWVEPNQGCLEVMR